MLSACDAPGADDSASTATTPQISFFGSSSAWATSSSSSCLEMFMSAGIPGGRRRGLPPHGRLEVLYLLDRERVDAAREVLPPVVGDHEHDVALVELPGDSHGDARYRTARDAGEQRLLVEQLAGPDDRILVGHEDLPVEQGKV